MVDSNTAINESSNYCRHAFMFQEVQLHVFLQNCDTEGKEGLLIKQYSLLV